MLKTKFLLLFLLCFTSVISIAQENKETYSLTITIVDFKNNNGKVWVALFNSKKDYLKKELKGASNTIENKKSSVTFTDLPKGVYAVSTFHDENSNDNLDTNGIGIPKEDYGFSNNRNATFGPPSYKRASFKLNKNTSITIELK